MNTTKENVISLLRAWIEQRPGLDPADYGLPAYSQESWREAVRAYRSEARNITRQLHDARELLRAVDLSAITADDIIAATSAYSGRLRIEQTKDGELRIDYCTGQYWPAEYRAAACAVLAQALWNYHRPDHMNNEHPGDSLRKMFKRMFGSRLASRWLD